MRGTGTDTRNKVGDSRFWEPLWDRYANAPSVALCRVPELEYASSLVVKGVVLDHCCGDGWFANRAWPGASLAAGCDLSQAAVQEAKRARAYQRVDQCDAAIRLPYQENCFDLTFNNSGLEHIADLGGALSEIARVTRRGGIFAFSVLNHRYFEWWPLDEVCRSGYREWQPFYHALRLSEWEAQLKSVGFELQEVQGYFDEQASKVLALLDCEFSGFFLRQRGSVLVSRYRSWPRIYRYLWHGRIKGLSWRTEYDAGAGYFIRAVRK